MAINHIIVGTDFTLHSQIAINKAIAVAKHTGAKVTVLHAGSVKERAGDLADGLSASATAIDRLAREELKVAHAKLESLRVGLGDDVEVNVELVDGFPDTVLCETAVQQNADLIVTGTQGRTGLQRFLLGSIAERVVRISERPVMVARADDSDPVTGFGNILIPTDFSETAQRAFELAKQLAAPNAKIEILHCWQLPAAALQGSKSVLAPIVASIEKELAERGKSFKEGHPVESEVTFLVVQDPPVQGIQDRLDAGSYDLVVMGTHGRRGLRRFLLGSVAEATIRHATCSVVVVPVGH